MRSHFDERLLVSHEKTAAVTLFCRENVPHHALIAVERIENEKLVGYFSHFIGPGSFRRPFHATRFGYFLTWSNRGVVRGFRRMTHFKYISAKTWIVNLSGAMAMIRNVDFEAEHANHRDFNIFGAFSFLNHPISRTLIKIYSLSIFLFITIGCLISTALSFLDSEKLNILSFFDEIIISAVYGQIDEDADRLYNAESFLSSTYFTMLWCIRCLLFISTLLPKAYLYINIAMTSGKIAVVLQILNLYLSVVPPVFCDPLLAPMIFPPMAYNIYFYYKRFRIPDNCCTWAIEKLLIAKVPLQYDDLTPFFGVVNTPRELTDSRDDFQMAIKSSLRWLLFRVCLPITVIMFVLPLLLAFASTFEINKFHEPSPGFFRAGF